MELLNSDDKILIDDNDKYFASLMRYIVVMATRHLLSFMHDQRYQSINIIWWLLGFFSLEPK